MVAQSFAIEKAVHDSSFTRSYCSAEFSASPYSRSVAAGRLGVVEHGVVARAVAKRKQRAAADLAGDGQDLAVLAALDLVEGLGENHLLVLLHDVLVDDRIALVGGGIGHVGGNHVVGSDAEGSHGCAHDLALAGRDHPDVKVVGTKVVEHLEHGLVEALAIGHAIKADDGLGGQKVGHVGAELLGRHAGKLVSDGNVLAGAVVAVLLATQCVFADVLAELDDLGTCLVRGIVEHTVKKHHIVDVDGSLLAKYGAVHVERRDAVCGLKVARARRGAVLVPRGEGCCDVEGLILCWSGFLLLTWRGGVCGLCASVGLGPCGKDDGGEGDAQCEGDDERVGLLRDAVLGV